MSTVLPAVRRLDRLTDAEISMLADVLVDCVEGGASVSFMLPLTRERAVAFWCGVVSGAGGECEYREDRGCAV